MPTACTVRSTALRPRSAPVRYPLLLPRFISALGGSIAAVCSRHRLPLDRQFATHTQERRDQSQDVKSYSDDCSRQLQHALIMPESARVCRCRMSQQPRRELLRSTA